VSLTGRNLKAVLVVLLVTALLGHVVVAPLVSMLLLGEMISLGNLLSVSRFSSIVTGVMLALALVWLVWRAPVLEHRFRGVRGLTWTILEAWGWGLACALAVGFLLLGPRGLAPLMAAVFFWPLYALLVLLVSPFVLLVWRFVFERLRIV
jgi:hypothetical protein